MLECGVFIEECREFLVELKEFRDEIEGFFGITNIKTAKEIMGAENFLGPEEVFETFGVNLKESEIPRIPFSRKELEAASKLGQMLILRIGKTATGARLTMKKINEQIMPRFPDRSCIFAQSLWSWYRNEDFCTKDIPINLDSGAQWALVSAEVIPPGYSNKDCVFQVESLVKYLEEGIIPSLSRTKKDRYENAIANFKSQKEILFKLRDQQEWREFMKHLLALEINQICRQTPVQALYDIVFALVSKNRRLLGGQRERSYRTVNFSTTSHYINASSFYPHGVYFYTCSHGSFRDRNIGIIFSRTF